MFFGFKVGRRNVWLWKVEDACNWPCWPHWVKLFGRSVSLGGGTLLWLEDSSIPESAPSPNIDVSLAFPHGKPPPRLFVISPKSTAAPTVPLAMHLGAFSQLQFPMALQGLAYIPPAEWQCWTFLLKTRHGCTVTQNEVRRKVECYRRSGRFKMRVRFPTADDGC